MSVETIIALLGALGVGGLLGSILTRRYEQQKQTNEHDVRIFRQSNSILVEQNLSEIIESHLLGNYSIDENNFSLLIRWCKYFEQTGNQYLDRTISNECQKLVNDLGQLTEFIALNFFMLREQNPSNRNKYLKPDWNPDYADDSSLEKTKKYNEYANELKNLTGKVLNQYSKYRLVIKRKLKI